MSRNDRKRQRSQQKRAAKVRARKKKHIEAPRTYFTPFGVIISSQNPQKMHLREVGGIDIHRPRIEAEIQVRQEAERALRATFEPGRYTNPEQINQILQGHFQFYDNLLKQMLPQLASRHFMEFILHQYDQSCEIDWLFKKGKLSSDDMEFWSQAGPRWRRSLKYLAECSCLLAPEEAPAAGEEEILDLTDRAVIYAESLVYLSTLSDQTYMIFPDRTELTISAEGKFEYLNLKVNPEVGEKFQKRVWRDLQIRGKYIPLDYPLFDRAIRGEELNEGFSKALGLTYDETFSLIGAIVDRVEVPPGGFPIPFVEERDLLETASVATGVPQQTIAKLLRGITVSRANMVVEGRKVWKPKQEHRAYRRAFFDFSHPSGAHLTWSDGMAKESLLLLIRDLAFQHIPPEWEAPSIRASLSALSNRCGKEFEQIA